MEAKRARARARLETMPEGFKWISSGVERARENHAAWLGHVLNHLQVSCANEHKDLRPVLGEDGTKFLYTQRAIPARRPG
eukprot:2011221-Alexandrium_andersonii.AAC.1